MRFTYLILLSLLFVFSCKQDPRKNEILPEKAEASFRLKFLLEGNVIAHGDTLEVLVVMLDSNRNADEVVIEVLGKSFATVNGRAKLTTDHFLSGRNIVTGVLKSGEKEERKSMTVEVWAANEPIRYGYKIVQTLPHDPQAYTQGFVWHEGSFYEGTGLEKKSSLREIDAKTGVIKRSVNLAPQYFGEGVAIYNDKIYQLTWKNRKGFVYDLKSFNAIKEFSYATEGWGLTTMDSVLVMSDGTEMLYFLHPEGLNVVGKLEVCSENGPIKNINELEFINGKIWANLYGTDLIAIIDPKTGFIEGTLDAMQLLNTKQQRNADVLNGIAYDPVGNRIFLTGKLWPSVFQIELVKRPQL